ncbi:MAG: hypothetical protein HC898_03625 [Phycisphaerales bacterium]|nr:hypothetical protein [Phycisphaerales bacterium]
MQSEIGQHIIADLNAAGVDMTQEATVIAVNQSNQGTTFTGKTIVITGTLASFERSDLKRKLESMGAKVTDSVSKKPTCSSSGRALARNSTKPSNSILKFGMKPDCSTNCIPSDSPDNSTRMRRAMAPPVQFT